MHQAAYRFFDAAFLLETDSPEFLATFDRAYGASRTAEGVDGPVYRVLLEGSPTCRVGAEPVRSPNAEAMRLYAYNAILHAALARVRSHWLFHGAGLVSPQGKGVILAGAAGLGKTTLTLALLDRGFGFLSDDVAAVGRTPSPLAGKLCPFARALGRRVPGAPPGEKEWLKPEVIASPCVPAHLFVLAGEAAVAQAAWYAVVERQDEQLLADVRGIEGMRSVEWVRGGPYPALRLQAQPGTLPAAEADVEAACRRHGALLFELVQGHSSPPDFSRGPRMEPLTAAEAAHALLRHVRGGQRSALVVDEFGGRAGRLYGALATLTGSLHCHRLVVGRLEAMLEQIVSAVAR